jgi:predicted DNA-binding transcriptional regulator YafY
MDRTERFYKIESLLASRTTINTKIFLETLGVSRATFRRDLDYMRDRLGTPIVWDQKTLGYRLVKEQGDENKTSLPGLWLSNQEIYSLLSLIRLQSNLQATTVFGGQVSVVRKRLEEMLLADGKDPKRLDFKVRILSMAAPSVDQSTFDTITNALITKKQLYFINFNRYSSVKTCRTVSPQRLIHHKDAWYLDTWCHDKHGFRTFSVDNMTNATLSDNDLLNFSEDELKREFETTYGVFGGAERATAKLKFTPFKARWISKETWHPNQKSHFDTNGYYFIELPYRDDKELICDVLRHGPDCEVLEPEELKIKVLERIRESLKNYERD